MAIYYSVPYRSLHSYVSSFILFATIIYTSVDIYLFIVDTALRYCVAQIIKT